MKLQSIPVKIATGATPVTVLRTASAAVHFDSAALPRRTESSRDAAPELSFSIYTDLGAIEGEWRNFQQVAECTPFQTFEWLSAWQRHIGARQDIGPAIVVGSFAHGKTAFILPLAIEQRRWSKRLCWLGEELCDYNAPLLARDFTQRVTADGFLAFWRTLQARMQSDPRLRHDWIEFTKMPQTVGVQVNPFTYLDVAPNANSAHITQLGDDWETFYRDKRSSATRRRDRAKRKRMSEFGEIRFVTATAADDVRRTLDTLWAQKKQIFARKGIADVFSQPGYRELFDDFASSPQTRHLVHVSRVEIGTTCAAANFAVIFGDCYYHLLSSYCDGALSRLGPGVLHLRDLLAYAIKSGLRLFDFTIGDEKYKLEWSDLRLSLYDHSVSVTGRGVPASCASAVRRRIKRFIKQTPLVWHLVRRIRSTLGPF
jgi:CelD/BcsL family acetyltransferase involved in cellulose biosynthesis